ncbi:MAG: ATP-dependent DNA helicase [Phormidesmis sp. RL_2_1]|nr:ATP-dependent DNA helicase [Phormidesmis sp. RL_2_1]
MIETEVHQRLRAYLREQGHTQWPHHLTMARLVARALRVGRSALMQVDSLAAHQGSHRLSYLIPALLWPEPAILALSDDILNTVLLQDIPNLQQNLPVVKSVRSGDSWPSENENFRGLLVTSAQRWLSSHLDERYLEHLEAASTSQRFPAGIPVLIDGVGDLERWARSHLTLSLTAQDWDALMLAYPNQRPFIRDMRVRVTHTIFQHPANPYGCHLLEAAEKTLLNELYEVLQFQGDGGRLPLAWQRFWAEFSQLECGAERMAWSRLNRDLGQVVLQCGPTTISERLAPIWAKQPVVLMGAALDTDTKATRYRAQLGLSEMTCLSFGPDRHHDLVQLYLPDRLPLPNTSHFKSAVLKEIRMLLNARGASIEPNVNHPTVIVIGDMPLKAQFAAILAAEFGSRVQLEGPIERHGILITGWGYWRSHQATFAAPGLLIITTLPIPSLENPLVAGRVASYKRQRQDWFQAYLLPEAISELQQAVAPVRSHRTSNGTANGGVIALLDNRVNYRSYGRQILAALSPIARSSYFNEDWFHTDISEPLLDSNT